VTVSFEARKLRVQLPCGEQTLIEPQQPQQGDILCRFPSCNFGTCGFVSPGTGTCRFPTIACHFGSCPLGSCGFFSPQTCPFGSCGFVSPQTCHFGTCGITIVPTGCPGGSVDPPIDPGTIVIDPEHLPVLKEQLQAQLKEIENAEQALKDRESNQ
jgi:hypothetical protein